VQFAKTHVLCLTECEGFFWLGFDDGMIQIFASDLNLIPVILNGNITSDPHYSSTSRLSSASRLSSTSSHTSSIAHSAAIQSLSSSNGFILSYSVDRQFKIWDAKAILSNFKNRSLRDYFWKLSPSFSGRWQKRFFEFDKIDRSLRYFINDVDRAMKGGFYVMKGGESGEKEYIQRKDTSKNNLQIFSDISIKSDSGNVFHLIQPTREFSLRSASSEVKEEWFQALSQAIRPPTFSPIFLLSSGAHLCKSVIFPQPDHSMLLLGVSEKLMQLWKVECNEKREINVTPSNSFLLPLCSSSISSRRAASVLTFAFSNLLIERNSLFFTYDKDLYQINLNHKNSSSSSKITTNSLPIQSTPTQPIPIQSTPTQSSPTRSTPTQSSPTRSSPTQSTPTQSTVFQVTAPIQGQTSPKKAKRKNLKMTQSPPHSIHGVSYLLADAPEMITSICVESDFDEVNLHVDFFSDKVDVSSVWGGCADGSICQWKVLHEENVANVGNLSTDLEFPDMKKDVDTKPVNEQNDQTFELSFQKTKTVSLHRKISSIHREKMFLHSLPDRRLISLSVVPKIDVCVWECITATPQFTFSISLPPIVPVMDAAIAIEEHSAATKNQWRVCRCSITICSQNLIIGVFDLPDVGQKSNEKEK
jgi:hypothetical protein